MSQGRTKLFSIHATLDHIHVRGDAEQDLRLLANELWRSLPARPTDRGIDFLDIAAGVYAVDRVVKRQAGAGNETGIRSLRLCFAVKDLAFWQRSEITEAVEAILSFLTDENWSIAFEQAAGGLVPQQERLDLSLMRSPRRIALYSGGLDSAAGLANRILAGIDDYLLVTVGHHNKLKNLCTEQIRQLSRLTSTPFQLNSTLTVHLQGGVTKQRMRQQESSQRSRAFLFCAAAAVAAQTCQIEEIEIFENGVGAINLPLMSGMLVGGLATRGAHPTFLKLMGQLASAVAENPVRYSLPFSMLTKAEMLVPLKKIRGLEEWAQQSRSCVHTSLRERKARHCGQCPGCIERRQAFAAADIAEPIAGQYSFDLFEGKKLASNNAAYMQCYLDDAAAWLAADAKVRRRLHWHLRGTDVPPEEDRLIAERQYRHAQEVISTLGHLTAQCLVRATTSPAGNTRSISHETFA